MPVADAEDDVRKRTTEIGEWDQKFIAVDQEMLFEIILAANYLDIKPLLCVPWSSDSFIHLIQLFMCVSYMFLRFDRHQRCRLQDRC